MIDSRVFVTDDGVQERCDGCGQMFTVTSSAASADFRASRCADCMTSQTRRAPVVGADSFSIHSLVGDTASQHPSAAPPSGTTKRPATTAASAASSSPFLVHAAAAHAQYYALAASGLLPAINYGARSSRVARLPLDWASSSGQLAAKHRYGV